MIRLLNELDAARITRLASMGFPPELDEAIDHADLCSPVEVPADLVTMNSCLEMRDLKTGVVCGGEQCAAKIVRILFQPEAVGDYAT